MNTNEMDHLLTTVDRPLLNQSMLYLPIPNQTAMNPSLQILPRYE
jgi:hypothetical protein